MENLRERGNNMENQEEEYTTVDIEGSQGYYFWVCDECRTILNWKQKICPGCERQVNWNE